MIAIVYVFDILNRHFPFVRCEWNASRLDVWMAPMETAGRRIDWATPTVVQFNTEFIVHQISSDTIWCVCVGKKLDDSWRS